MRAKVFCGVWLALAVGYASAWAQASKPGMGTVTGRVICQDTQKPARFARVLVFQVPASLVLPRPPADLTDTKASAAWMNAQDAALNSATLVVVETGIDGSFAAANVPPGDYYVMASVAGYILPKNLLQAAYDAGEDLSKGISGVPIVHVSTDRAVNGEITVSRGAAIEGHVMWDDGSPVSGAMVAAEPKGGDHKNLPLQFARISIGMGSAGSGGITDDRGRYRISGLAPGEYTVRALLMTNESMSIQHGRLDQNAGFGTTPLVVYAPNAFHKADAKPLKLAAGEERSDEDVTFKLDGMHSVSGRVASAEDHHGLGRGVVRLIDANDKTFQRSAGLDADGNFNVTFVPSGTYTMTVVGMEGTPTEVKLNNGASYFDYSAARSYQNVTRQLIVGDSDVTGQNVELKPVKAQNADSDAGSAGSSHVVVETGH